jgi:DNA-binding response OmpR family regulator
MAVRRKQAILIADNLDNIHKFQTVLNPFDVDTSTGSSTQFQMLVSNMQAKAGRVACDLAICEMHLDNMEAIAQIEEALMEYDSATLLLIVEEESLSELRLPLQIKSDFVLHGATYGECSARIRQLLFPGVETLASDVLSVDGLTLNLATYQVAINSEPLDLTYLEYALLAFLVTHPGRTYSRDALLKRVWGFDYYGGSRTVDVHVRRIRAKLGPELSQRLETVRSVGYLWLV